MAKRFFVALTALVAACEYQTSPRNAPQRYSCTVEQMARVEHETSWCSENTDYFKSWCYGSAIMRNCSQLAVVPNG